MKPEPVLPQNAAPPVGPYSHAVRFGPFLFLSGQIPISKDGNIVPGGIREQTTQVLENVKTILDDQNLGLESVIKTTVFMVDLGEFAAMNEVYTHIFGQNRPARSTIQVAALPRQALIEIEIIAAGE